MDSDKKEYSGMTLNEMLYEAGLMKDFDSAIRKKDKTALIRILKSVNIAEKSASKIIESIFSNPEKYGY